MPGSALDPRAADVDPIAEYHRRALPVVVHHVLLERGVRPEADRSPERQIRASGRGAWRGMGQALDMRLRRQDHSLIGAVRRALRGGTLAASNTLTHRLAKESQANTTRSLAVPKPDAAARSTVETTTCGTGPDRRTQSSDSACSLAGSSAANGGCCGDPAGSGIGPDTVSPAAAAAVVVAKRDAAQTAVATPTHRRPRSLPPRRPSPSVEDAPSRRYSRRRVRR